MERALVEYIANALWQVPLLAGGAWLFLWAVRSGPRVQHGMWLGVLALAVVLPMHGMRSGGSFAVKLRPVGASAAVEPTFDTAVDSVDSVAPVAPRQQLVASGELMRPVVKKTVARRDWFAVAPRVRSVYLAANAVDWLVRAYVAAVLFGIFRIVRAWRAAQHLVESSREITPCQREMARLEGYGKRLGVRLPEVRESSAVASPMIVGLVAPVLLLPEGFWRHTEDEVRAALWHELAHVKRRDYLVNLACQVVALPVGWHPATYAVQRRIRRTREMVCDAMAAREMQSEIGYARCLLAMARSMLGGRGMVEQAEGLGLFGNNILEERVMRLMETKTAVSVRARIARAASGATMMIAATALATMFHVVPTMAEQNMVPAIPAVPSLPAPPAMPVAAVASAPEPVPQAEMAPVTPAPEPVAAVPPSSAAPVPPVAPLPPSAPALFVQDGDMRANGQDEITIRTEDGKPFVIVNGVRRELTPEERRRLDREMVAARKQIAEATAKINSPEFKKQIADAQKEALDAAAKVNSPEFKKQIEDAQKEALEATALVNSPEFEKQIEDARKEAQDATARINSPEFKQQMEDMKKQLQSGEMERQMKEASERLKEAQEELREETSH
jgi:beta-lactamase regulating signal transducer with metallopeptidase domain